MRTATARPDVSASGARPAAAVRPATAGLASCHRRQLLSLALPLLLPAAPRLAGAAGPLEALGLGGGSGGDAPQVRIVSQPSVCQGRVRFQDFVILRYKGLRADGTPFDSRYAENPLVYELGSFYLPGVDAALNGACAGTKLKLSWASSPRLPRADDAALLPAGEPITLEAEVVSIKYSLFGEKMRDPTSSWFFAREPLTLTSAYDARGHPNRNRVPSVKKDNPFSIAPGEQSIISNPSNLLTPLFSQGNFDLSKGEP